MVSRPPTAPIKRRRIITVGRVLLLLFALLSVGSCVTLRYVTARFVFPIAESDGSAPAVASRGVEVVEYVTSDKVTLRGLSIRSPDGDGSSAIVLFHGNGESAQGEVAFAKRVSERFHVDVLVGEYRGYGGTLGSPSEEGLYRDGRAAVLATKHPPNQVVLAGWSLGTGVALELAHEDLGRAVVLMAPFTSIDDTARALLKDPEAKANIRTFLGSFGGLLDPLAHVIDGPGGRLLFADHFDALTKASSLHIPLFVVHGTEDRVVPYAEGEAIAHIAPKSVLLTATGSDHFVEDTPEALDAIERALAVR